MENQLEHSYKIQWVHKTITVAELKPFEKNPRKISAEDFERLVASIDEDGYHQRILTTQDLRVIGGHQRIKALKQLGYEKIEVLVADRDVPDEQFKRILVRDNVEYGVFDIAELDGFMPIGELAEIGVGDAIVRKLDVAVEKGKTDPDEIPVEPATPIAQVGDLWQLGLHRIACGDSTDADTVKRLFAGIQPMLMVTDPPYGVNYDASWRDGHDLNIGKKIGHKGTGRALGKVENDDRADWRETWALFPGDVAYVWCASLFSDVVIQSLESTGLFRRSQIIWVKQHFTFGRGDYHWQHEPCWYAVRKGKSGNYNGDRKQTTVWEIANNNPFGTGGKAEEKLGHSTQKPVACMERPILNNSAHGQEVYDPFLGSGTTVMAAERTGRICYGVELNPAYVDITIARWEAYTGKKAEKVAA